MISTDIRRDLTKQNVDSGTLRSGLRLMDGGQDQVHDFPIEKDWIGEYDNAPSCTYNCCVGCLQHHCENCGWNPFVSLERVILKYGENAADYLTPPGC